MAGMAGRAGKAAEPAQGENSAGIGKFIET
jgi:hypothetical protein